MLVISFILGFLVFCFGIEGLLLDNMTCPEVAPRELDWKEMDGTWYLAAVATDLDAKGDCAMVIFEHQDTLGVSIQWITNNTVRYYNGSVSLIPDPKSNSTPGDLLQVTYEDQRTESYKFLDINYDHYAVVFACYDNEDNTSTYEIWKMTRSPHLKNTDASKLDQAIANYSLQNTPFITFNNTEDTCWVNSGTHIDTSAVVMTSAAALTLFNRFY